jgi:putative addiction module component (TIGR02574 family)
MPATLDALSQDALVLQPDERLMLACRLLASVEPEPTRDMKAAWDAEIARRMAAYRAGEIASIPADEVFAELREIAPD